MELLDGLHFIGDAELRVFVLTELVERKQMHLPHARLPQIRRHGLCRGKAGVKSGDHRDAGDHRLARTQKLL